ncbi:MliC family protein [Rhizobium leucaenae]|uniref:Membrane-bound inhibitor of C-type lysozyme n=1 Tax=Rhizobium leucaenae TaxID=29450 RepID=A0A7W7EMS4_9HYPH|nr:MliC family protein [Rhizobium leucaenae]MBB4570812.1 membrane-bound inhibitor of C-type lysozyme [Rhizobium leucaenae]MBB6303646.1 membrane-bound inhibitor of C-type lysozyme [Rhizobium leucaenae]
MNRIGMAVFGPLSAIFLLSAACAFAQDHVGIVYRCDDGTTLTASFMNSTKEALITTGGNSFRLPQAMSGSGARYTDGNVLFWIKGKDAQLELAGRSTNCHTQ